MGSRLLVNPYPMGMDITQSTQILSGSVQLYGSAVTTGEPIDWSDLVTGIGYNEINFAGNGINGQNCALVTALSGDGTTVTATAANNFFVGQVVIFQGCTSAMGLLLNGVAVTVASASASQFTFLNASNTTGTNEVGVAYGGKNVYPLSPATSPLTASVTAISASSTTLTVTAANTFLPGAMVTFSVSGTLGVKITAAGPMKVIKSTTSAFTVKMPSALTGSTGTGTAVGYNPPQPFDVVFHSALGSGYTYQYSCPTGVLYVVQPAGFTPAGTVAAPAFTGESYTPAGTVASGTLSIGAGTPATYPVGTAANTGSTTLVATGAVTVPLPSGAFSGTAHTLAGTNSAPAFTGSAVAAAPLGALSAAAYPAAVLADVIKYTARFQRG